MATIEDVLSRQERIEKLFNQLVDSIELNQDMLEEYAKELCDVYSDNSFRHSYAEISKVLEQYSPDQRDALAEHVHTLQKAVLDLNKSQDINNRVLKLCDHVDLECIRIGRIDKVEYIGRMATKELSDADGKLQETEKRAEDLKERIEGYQNQSITILGIFAGLVVAFAGVTQFVSSGLKDLSDISIFKITFFIGFSFLFLYKIIFLLLYCVSKISGRSISVNCKKRNCADCKSCRTNFGRLHKKYPYIFWFNIMGVFFCTILCIIAMRA